MSSQAFDGLAADYDESFTNTPLGRLLRDATWQRIDAIFAPGLRVLDIGCGTGEDAVHLARRGVQVVATDASQSMVDATRHKADTAGVGSSVRTATVDISTIAPEDLASTMAVSAAASPGAATSGAATSGAATSGAATSGAATSGAATSGALVDGVLANFGSLNCVADLERVSSTLAEVTRAGGTLVAVVMGPLVPWEWAWYLAYLSPREAVRRLARSTQWRGLTIRYPSIRRFRQSFEAAWRPVRVQAIGVALPPSYVDPLMRRHPRVLSTLAAVESTIGSWPLSAQIADHYLIELVRR